MSTKQQAQTVRLIQTGRHTADTFLQDETRFPRNPYSQRCEDIISAPLENLGEQFTRAMRLMGKGARLDITIYNFDGTLAKSPAGFID
jgi:hypothetical protein